MLMISSTLNRISKRIVSAVAPELFLQAKAARARAHSEKLERGWGCSDLTAQFIGMHGDAIVTGPFSGLRFPESVHHRHLVPKLLGAYERHLHPVIESLLGGSYSTVIDVGAAEGYYAMGFAMRMPSVPVVAFDTDPWSRKVVLEGATLNGLANLSVKRTCTPKWLARNLAPNALLVIDCEGFEDVLLRPASSVELYTADILVETHETASPGVTERLRQRFGQTHYVTVIRQDADRTSHRVIYEPYLRGLPDELAAMAFREYRSHSQVWLHMEPKNLHTRRMPAANPNV